MELDAVENQEQPRQRNTRFEVSHPVDELDNNTGRPTRECYKRMHEYVKRAVDEFERREHVCLSVHSISDVEWPLKDLPIMRFTYSSLPAILVAGE